MIKNFILALIILTLSSCASIVSKSQYPVSINSSPDGAKFTISNKKGVTIHSGETPDNIILAAGDGYFGKAKYSIKYEKKGYDSKTYELTPTLNGWYWGNILFGGLIGMLIVDPVTGAMYKLPDVANVSLDSNRHSSNNEIRIMSLDQLTGEQKARLISIN